MSNNIVRVIAVVVLFVAGIVVGFILAEERPGYKPTLEVATGDLLEDPNELLVEVPDAFREKYGEHRILYNIARNRAMAERQHKKISAVLSRLQVLEKIVDVNEPKPK